MPTTLHTPTQGRATRRGAAAAAAAALALAWGAAAGPAWAEAAVTPLASASASASASAAAPREAAEVAKIAQVLDLLHASAARSDAKTYFQLFAPDAVFIGTDVAERWPIADFRAFAEPVFAQGKGWTYTVRHREVKVAATACHCMAWFDEVLDSQKYGTSRGTGVLLRGPAGWKIEQYALTFPMPNDLAADFTQRIRDFEKKAGK